MIYFDSKTDLQYIENFKRNVLLLWDYEEKANNRKTGYCYDERSMIAEANKIEGYSEIRTQVSEEITRASKIADMNNVPIHIKSIPPPAVGGVIIPINLFETILHDNSYGGIDNQMIIDALNRTIGACKEKVRNDFRKVVNPLYWLKTVFSLILRIPFMILRLAGFNVATIENHILSKIFKVIEALLIIYLLIKLGMKREDIVNILISIFGK